MIALALLAASVASAASPSICPLHDARIELLNYVADRYRDFSFPTEAMLDGLPDQMPIPFRQKLRDDVARYRLALYQADESRKKNLGDAEKLDQLSRLDTEGKRLQVAADVDELLDTASAEDRARILDFFRKDFAEKGTDFSDEARLRLRLALDGPEPGSLAPSEPEAVFAAAGKGCLEDVRAMVEGGAKADPGPTYRERPILAAAQNCRYDVVAYLADRGADLEARGEGGKTAALLAYDGGCPDLTWKLLDRGADVDAADASGETLLARAARNDNYTHLVDLLGYGADAKNRVKGKLPIELLPKKSIARTLFSAKSFRAFERETDFEAVPEADRVRLGEGKVVWRWPYYRFQLVMPDWGGKGPWEHVAAAASRWVSDLIRKEAGPRPIPPVLVKSEYESKARFAARVAAAKAEFDRRSAEYDRKVKDFPVWKRNAVLEKTINVSLLRTYVSNVRYDADQETFFVTVQAPEEIFNQQFRILEKVPNEKAEALGHELKTAEPIVFFSVAGDAVAPSGASFVAQAKEWRAVPDSNGGPAQAVAVVDLAGPPPAVVALNPKVVEPAPGSETVHSDVDDAPEAIAAPRPHDFALIVGIESYQDETLPRASYAEGDADAVAVNLAALGVPKDNVLLLKGQKATSAQLKSYLDSYLAKNVKPDSRVYFYFSGHGAPDPETGRAYLVPWDSSPKFLKETGIAVSSVYESLARLKVKEALVATDSCFSGSGARSVSVAGARPLRTVVDDDAPQGVTALAAAGSDQIARSLDDQGHGAFTYYFLKGLRDGAKDTGALCAYLADNVKAAAARQNGVQTPVCKGPVFAFK